MAALRNDDPDVRKNALSRLQAASSNWKAYYGEKVMKSVIDPEEKRIKGLKGKEQEAAQKRHVERLGNGDYATDALLDELSENTDDKDLKQRLKELRDKDDSSIDALSVADKERLAGVAKTAEAKRALQVDPMSKVINLLTQLLDEAKKRP